ncbi:MAG TPA: Uma2 family endonuclease [Longimicrobium sp.]|nr:Uma2 family endonuclease [Longimicrobium sp.]
MDAAIQVPTRQFSSDEFERMGDLGILPKCAELIYGEVQDKTGRGTPHTWTYEQYLALSHAGILAEDERTELLDGKIVSMTPVGHRHVYIVDNLVALLGPWAPGRAILRVQSPVRFNTVDAPQPDVTLLRLHPDRYRSREAGPWDALLMVEVADSSVVRDREIKGPMYARAAVPEFWLVDVNRGSVVVHMNPVAGEYTSVREYSHRDAWNSPALDGRSVQVEEVLGPE